MRLAKGRKIDLGEYERVGDVGAIAAGAEIVENSELLRETWSSYPC